MPYDRVPKSYFAYIAVGAPKTVDEDVLAINHDDVVGLRYIDV
jgi:hypothetical protein